MNQHKTLWQVSLIHFLLAFVVYPSIINALFFGLLFISTIDNVLFSKEHAPIATVILFVVSLISLSLGVVISARHLLKKHGTLNINDVATWATVYAGIYSLVALFVAQPINLYSSIFLPSDVHPPSLGLEIVSIIVNLALFFWLTRWYLGFLRNKK